MLPTFLKNSGADMVIQNGRNRVAFYTHLIRLPQLSLGILRRQRPITNVRKTWMHTLVRSIGYQVRLSALQRVCVLL
jgi:hypothetical protein